MAIGYRKRKKRGNYKFTEKTQSKRGIAGFAIAAVSIGILSYVVWNSFSHEGAGSMYLGSAGVTSMLLSVVAVVVSVMSLGEEDSFKLFPYLGTFCSGMVLAAWIALYVIGIVLA